MRRIAYCAEYLLLPLLFLVILSKNTARLQRQAWSWTTAEMRRIIRNHKRHYNKGTP